MNNRDKVQQVECEDLEPCCKAWAPAFLAGPESPLQNVSHEDGVAAFSTARFQFPEIFFQRRGCSTRNGFN